jgi:subtilisin family serine protease
VLEIIAFDTHAAALLAAAAVPEVLHVGPGATALIPEDEGTAQIIADNIEARQPVPGYPDFLDEIGLDGSGVTLSILDTGVDGNHPDLAGRVVDKIEYSATPVVGEPHDTYGHGTHVAGIVAGSGAPLPGVGDIRDEDGFLYGQGVAPGTELVDQNAISVTRGSFPPQGGWERLSRDALRAGAIGWNASLHSGEGTGAGYIASARMLDVLTRDGDFDTDGDQAFTMVWSAGNAGGNPQTMTSPKEAKNIITVGSTLSQRAGPIDMVSGFSSRGPAVDGRILPTVVAPGQLVASAIPVPASALHALCLGPELQSFGLHATCSGTSMAAPHVTGAVALIHQWWTGSNDDDPSPAMSKALLINTATPLGRQPTPNNNEGWGMVNLGELFDPDASRVYVDQDVVLTGVDEEVTLTVTPADPTQPLKVSLVWTDAPGAPGADPALVNDLDLEVTNEDGTTWRGNHFESFWSVAGGEPDRLNNLENVFIQQAGDGSYTITIRAHNLPEPAIPEHPSEVNQDFALVVSNAIAVTD